MHSFSRFPRGQAAPSVLVALLRPCPWPSCRLQLEAACKAMEKLAGNAQRLVQQEKGLSRAARAAAAGPVPSLDQCLQGLQDIW